MNRFLKIILLVTITVSSVSSINISTASASLTDGLVAHYTFDDNTNDSAGTNNGTASGGPSYVEGKVGKALQFDGTNDYITLSNTSAADMTTNNFTVSLWLKTNTTATTQYRLISKRGSDGYEIYLGSGQNGLAAYCDTTGGGCLNDNNLGTASVRDMKWHHAVVVFDRSGNMTGYVDGNVGSSPSNISAAVGSMTVAQNLMIGQYSNGGGDYFNGTLDDVRVYNRALSADEIIQLYNQSSDSTPDIPVEEVPDDTPTDPTSTPTQYNLSVLMSGSGNGSISGTGISCGTDCSEVVNSGTQVTLTASPANSSSIFSGWSGGGCSGTGNCVVTVSSDKTVTATFTTQPLVIDGKNTVTQSMFYTKNGLYNGYVRDNTGFHPFVADSFPGHYIKAADLKGISQASIIPLDQTYYGDNLGNQVNGYPASEAAVKLSVGGDSISLDLVNIEYGVYVIRLVGRVNQPTIPRIRKPLYVHLKINDGPNGEVNDYRMRVLYSNNLEETGRIFFNALKPNNNLHAELFVGPGSQEDLLIHRIDFFDALADIQKKAVKTSATTYTAEEKSSAQTQGKKLIGLGTRSSDCGFFGIDYCGDNIFWQWFNGGYTTTPAVSSAETRRQRDDIIWNALPPLNAMTAGIDGTYNAYDKWPNGMTTAEVVEQYGKWELDPIVTNQQYIYQYYDRPWKIVNKKLNLEYTLEDYKAHKPLPDPYPFKDDGSGVYFPASTHDSPGTYQFIIAPLILQRIQGQYSTSFFDPAGGPGLNLPYRYFLTNDEKVARDTALALVRFSSQWPAFQFEAQDLAYNSALPELVFNGAWRWTNARIGKVVGIKEDEIQGYLYAYDYLFDYIKNNQELADAVHRYIPWVQTPDDIIELIDTHFVKSLKNDISNKRVIFTKPLLIDLVLQDTAIEQTESPMDISKIINFIHPLTTSLKNHYSNSFTQNGTMFIGSSFYVIGESSAFINMLDPMTRYKDSTGKSIPYDLTNLDLFPKVREYCNTFSDYTVAGGYEPSFGDAADTIYEKRQLNPGLVSQIKNMWRFCRNPKAAWLLVNVVGRTDQSNTEWSSAQSAANNVRDPRISSNSRTLNGLGLGILESGVSSNDYRDKRAVMVRTGSGYGHEHHDALDLSWFALGLRMGTDYGQRNEGNLYTVPNDEASNTHNVLEVDGLKHPLRATDGWPSGSFSASDAWISVFAPENGAQYISAQSKSADHTNVNIFRRDTSLIDIDDKNSYVFDVFRVGGGQMHTWSFHGADTSGESGGLQVNVPMNSTLDSDASQYLRKHAEGTRTQGVATNKIEATWRLGRTSNTANLNNADGASLSVTTVAAEQSMLGSDYNASSPRKYTKTTLFDRSGDKVMMGNLYSAYYKINEPNLFVQSGTGGSYNSGSNKQDVYPAIIEAYAGSSLISASQSLSVTPNESDALKAVALSVTTTNGNNDILFSDGRNTTRTIGGGTMTANAQFGYYSSNAGNMRMMTIVGGTNLTKGNYSLKPSVAVNSSTIQSVNYRDRKIYTSSKFPKTLINRDFHIKNTDHETSYKIINIVDSGSGSILTFEKPADIGVLKIDGLSGNTITSSDSWILDYTPNRNRGLTGTNESGSKVFKIKKTASNGGSSNTISGASVSQADFTDIDGDGISQVLVYDFGIGDTIEVASASTLKRVNNNDIYQLTSNTPLSVTLPGTGSLEISSNSSSWTKINSTLSTNSVTANITESQLLSGIKYVRASSNPGINLTLEELKKLEDQALLNVPLNPLTPLPNPDPFPLSPLNPTTPTYTPAYTPTHTPTPYTYKKPVTQAPKVISPTPDLPPSPSFEPLDFIPTDYIQILLDLIKQFFIDLIERIKRGVDRIIG